MPQNNPQPSNPPKTPVVPPPPPTPTRESPRRTEEQAYRIAVTNDMFWIKGLLSAILVVSIGSCVNTCSTDSAVRAERIIRPIR
jgi:hypothetical protein